MFGIKKNATDLQLKRPNKRRTKIMADLIIPNVMDNTNNNDKKSSNNAIGDTVPVCAENATQPTELTADATTTLNLTAAKEVSTTKAVQDPVPSTGTCSNSPLASKTTILSTQSTATTLTKQSPATASTEASAGIQQLITVSTSATNMGSKIPKDVEDVVAYASWPLSCPLEFEEYCISIICGNSRTHWAMHLNTNNSSNISTSSSSNASNSDFLPTLIWKTIKVVSCSSQNVDLTTTMKLVDYIPKAIKDIIYGPDHEDRSIASSANGTSNGGIGGSNASFLNDSSTTATCTPLRSATHRSIYRVPGISVYVLSTNDDNLKGIAQLFRNSIPCRVVLITANDFISSSIGTHQLQQIQLEQLQQTKHHEGPTKCTTQISASADDADKPNISTSNLKTTSSSSPVVKSSSNVMQVPSTVAGFYSGMGVDRICGIYAAQYLYETNHVLVIDGGTAMTYTATNASGSFYGGGIGPGLRMKFRSLFDYTSALPYITYDTLMKYISKQEKEAEKEEIAISTASMFATTTSESIIKSVLSESSSHLLKIIQAWLVETREDGPNTNVPTVVLTGGDIDIFQHLLKSYQRSTTELQNVRIVSNRSLLHHGVSAMLMRQRLIKYHNNNVCRQVSVTKQVTTCISGTNTSPGNTATMTLNEVRDVLMGQRVATIQNPNSSTGSNAGGISTTTSTGLSEVTTAAIVVGTTDIPNRSTILFGTVVNVINSFPQRATVDKDYYSIFWDIDGSIDDVTPRQLYEYLILYTKANESGRDTTGGDLRRAKLEEKRHEAKYAAALLAERSESVKGLVIARKQSLAATSKKTQPSSSVVATVSSSTLLSASVSNVGAKATNVAGTKRHREEGNLTTSATTSGSGKAVKAAATGAVQDSNAMVGDTASPTLSVAKRGRKNNREMPPLSELQNPNADPKLFLQKRMAKYFDGEVFFGYVKSFFPAGENDEGVDFWSIEYDDGDAEDLERNELVQAFATWYQNMKGDATYHEKLKKFNH